MRIGLPGWTGFGLAMAWLSLTAGAEAAPPRSEVSHLGAGERRTLLAGRRVERPLGFVRGGGRYVGGVSYQLVRTAPEQVRLALLDVENLARMLPRTRSARLVSSAGGQSIIELRQGRSPFVAEYTIVLERSETGDEVRFWMDPGYAHDIEDVWGFFRVRPFGSNETLLSVGVAVDLGPGFARLLFEERVQALILSAVTNIRDFVEPKRLAAVDRSFLVD